MFKELLTSPHGHDQHNFIYVVHAINPLYQGPVDARLVQRKLRRMRRRGAFYCGSLVGCLDTDRAQAMFPRYRVNAPISQTGTDGSYGFILDIPSDDVVAISSRADLHTPKGQAKLRGFVSGYRAQPDDPLMLLAMSEGSELALPYNELILKGDRATGIVGVFYQDDEGCSRNRQNGEVLAAAVQAVGEAGVPLIPIVHPEESLGVLIGQTSPDDVIRALRVRE
ncbi:MAG: hypothetical protein HY369_00360 [Candidatus Aenigmarchaeota archaeon]|nr:hypothetical protein [Candidatus Aenigmarchaeota archaeon]